MRLALLLLGLAWTVLAPHPASGATPFPQDLEAISTVGRDASYLFPSFQGLMSDNDTVRLGLDFQRMLRINHMLYIAARDHVFAVNLASSSDQIIPQQKLTWKSKDVAKCTVRGKNSDECYNYIKVLVPRNDETLFACGTNAFNPTCRNYKTGLYTDRALHRQNSTQTGLYTDRALHTQSSTQTGLYTDRALHRQSSTQTELYTDRALHRQSSKQTGLYTDRALHRQGSTHTELYTDRALHRQGSTQTELYTDRALHRQGSTQTGLFTDRALH
uniref:Sema domain-containing protein n=1 Tax=Knipowitschia caucasica TaxID=637954 RepID=A0AAV2MEA6_KNICA